MEKGPYSNKISYEYSSFSHPLILLALVFNSTRDQDTLEKTLECFAMCADISSHFKLTQAIDTIIVLTPPPFNDDLVFRVLYVNYLLFHQ